MCVCVCACVCASVCVFMIVSIASARKETSHECKLKQFYFACETKVETQNRKCKSHEHSGFVSHLGLQQLDPGTVWVFLGHDGSLKIHSACSDHICRQGHWRERLFKS